MKKIILGLVMILGLSGCAISGGTILAFAAGAVTVAENVADVAKVYKETKDYIAGNDNNSTKE